MTWESRRSLRQLVTPQPQLGTDSSEAMLGDQFPASIYTESSEHMLGIGFHVSIHTAQDPRLGMVLLTFKMILHKSVNTIKMIPNKQVQSRTPDKPRLGQADS